MEARIILGLLFAISVPLPAVESGVEEVVVLEEVVVDPTFRDVSWFVDTMATVVIRFPELVDLPGSYPDDLEGLDLGSVDVVVDEGGEGSAAVIRWMPREAGLVTFPSWSFESETTRYVSPARQIKVGVPLRSDEMSLDFRPRKSRIYVGEPLRLEVVWTSGLQANRQRALVCMPEFFSDEGVEVVVPRQEIEEKAQIGLPFGGRRIIARRGGADGGPTLGKVSFPLFLRFKEAGNRMLSETRLECAYLSRAGGVFAPYAAFFNNGLFEQVDEGSAYQRLFTESPARQLEVVELPQEGRLENFSGLFSPCQIEVSTKVGEIQVGGVLEVDLLVKSEGCHGMLELPDLSLQRSLRSWFKVDRELGRRWHPDGTLFRLRVRPLTTKVEVFPSLEIQVFDPERGEYKMLRTAAVPLEVHADEGRDYFDIKRSGADVAGLTDQAEGIRQNDRKNPMNDALNRICGWLADYYWFWLILGPVLFCFLLPHVRERRRRALDPEYRKRVMAYHEFLKIPEGDPRKWVAMKRFLAAGFGSEEAAWTSGDAYRHLSQLGATREDLEAVLGSQRKLDHELFSESKTSEPLPPLKGVGQRLFKLLEKVSVILLMGLILGGNLSAATGDWKEAEAATSKALAMESGSPEGFALFSEAGLKFEEVARSGERPGSAWYNAGNAWFQAGELGRSIACFRQAQIYRPFDPVVRESLKAARALTVDVVAADGGFRWIWPRRWLIASLVVASFAIWGLLLAFARFRKVGIMVGIGVLLLGSAGLASLLVLASVKDGKEGVVVVTEVYGRKGPSYRYLSAFQEALHDGLECGIVELRDGWLHLELADGRRCWVPEDQVRVLRNPC